MGKERSDRNLSMDRGFPGSHDSIFLASGKKPFPQAVLELDSLDVLLLGTSAASRRYDLFGLDGPPNAGGGQGVRRTFGLWRLAGSSLHMVLRLLQCPPPQKKRKNTKHSYRL